MANHRKTERNTTVSWLKVKNFRVEKNSRFVKFRYGYDDEFEEFAFSAVPVLRKRTAKCTASKARKTASVQVVSVSDIGNLQPERLFLGQQPISNAK